MKITFLSPPPNLSGGERVIAIYVRELNARGHDAEVVCSDYSARSLKQRIKGIFKSQSKAGNEWNGESHYQNYGVPFRSIQSHRPVRIDDLNKPDIVVATLWNTAIWLNSIHELKGKGAYLIQHDEAAFFGNPEAEDTYGFPLKHIYVSDWVAQRIRSRHPNAIGAVIRNAIDFQHYQCGPRIKPARLRVGMVWFPWAPKGSDIALSAIKLARQLGLDLDLVAFGSDSPPPEVRELFTFYERAPGQEHIAQLYQSCTVWLFTSRFEGFGLPILESMAAGTPVIATPTGAGPELVSQGGGFLAPMEDPTAVSELLVRFAEMNQMAWQNLSLAASRTAQLHTWELATTQFEHFVAKLIR